MLPVKEVQELNKGDMFRHVVRGKSLVLQTLEVFPLVSGNGHGVRALHVGTGDVVRLQLLSDARYEILGSW